MSHLNGFPKDEYDDDMVRDMTEKSRLRTRIFLLALKIANGETEFTDEEIEFEEKHSVMVMNELIKLSNKI